MPLDKFETETAVTEASIHLCLREGYDGNTSARKTVHEC